MGLHSGICKDRQYYRTLATALQCLSSSDIQARHQLYGLCLWLRHDGLISLLRSGLEVESRGSGLATESLNRTATATKGEAPGDIMPSQRGNLSGPGTPST